MPVNLSQVDNIIRVYSHLSMHVTDCSTEIFKKWLFYRSIKIIFYVMQIQFNYHGIIYWYANIGFNYSVKL